MNDAAELKPALDAIVERMDGVHTPALIEILQLVREIHAACTAEHPPSPLPELLRALMGMLQLVLKHQEAMGAAQQETLALLRAAALRA